MTEEKGWLENNIEELVILSTTIGVLAMIGYIVAMTKSLDGGLELLALLTMIIGYMAGKKVPTG